MAYIIYAKPIKGKYKFGLIFIPLELTTFDQKESLRK